MAVVELKLNPSRRELRQFGFISLGCFALLGGMVLWRRHVLWWELNEAALTAACALWVAGGLAAMFSLIRPGANRPLWVAMMLIAWPIGTALSYTLLAVVFYGLLTPTGLMFRLIGRDSLTRRLNPTAKSYWEPYRPADDIKRYFRQF